MKKIDRDSEVLLYLMTTMRIVRNQVVQLTSQWHTSLPCVLEKAGIGQVLKMSKSRMDAVGLSDGHALWDFTKIK